MLKLNYFITALAPITFAEKSGDNVLYATKRYVPGSALRGALAANYIKKHKLQDAHLDPTFFDLFLAGKVRFLPAYPKCDGIDKESSVIPLSFMASKDGRSIKDFAWDNTPVPGYKKMNGFAVIDEDKLYRTAANVQIEFHMSRSSDDERVTGSSKEGNVFNYEYLEPYQDFIGSIIVDDGNEELIAVLKQLLTDTLHLGRAKNAQYGSCRCTILGEENTCTQIKQDASIFLCAHTAYIPLKDWQRTDTVAKNIEAELNDALRAKGIDGTVIVSEDNLYAVAEAIDGYIGVWNMKRERKNAISAGALIGVELCGFDQTALRVLQDILYAGLGDRTAEGYGQFRLRNPLESISTVDLIADPIMPQAINKTVQQRACSILQKRILQEVHKQAKQDANNMCKQYSTKVTKAKSSLKRVEALMDSDLSKQDIQEKISQFRDAAMSNLHGLNLNGASVRDRLLEDNGEELPYAGIDWGARIELSQQKQNSLKQDLGADVLNVPTDILYREYWLWLARFCAKHKDKNENSAIKDQFNNSSKEGAH